MPPPFKAQILYCYYFFNFNLLYHRLFHFSVLLHPKATGDICCFSPLFSELFHSMDTNYIQFTFNHFSAGVVTIIRLGHFKGSGLFYFHPMLCQANSCPFYLDGCTHADPAECDLISLFPHDSTSEPSYPPAPLYLKFSYLNHWCHVPPDEVYPIWFNFDVVVGVGVE